MMLLTKLILIKPLLGLTALFVGWQALVFIRPDPNPLTWAQQCAVDGAAQSAAAMLQTKVAAPVQFAVAKLGDDATGKATAVLLQNIAGHDGWQHIETSPVRRFLDDIARTVVNATSLDEIINAGRGVGIDVLISGRLESVEDLAGGGAHATLQLSAYDMRKGTWVLRQSFAHTWTPTTWTRLRQFVGSVSVWLRVLLWLALILAPPWLLAPVVERVVAARSNAASAVLVLTLVVWSVGNAWLLSGLSAGFFGRGWPVILVAAVAACYNYLACEQIAARCQ